MEVKIVNNSKFDLPQYATSGSAGIDLKANIEESIILKPLERKLIKTGIHIQLPKNGVAYICPRSGLAFKNGISIINSPGVIDNDYTGDVGVILINMSNEDFIVNPGERIAQMVISTYEQAQFNQLSSIEEFESTERGSGGFGSTGKS